MKKKIQHEQDALGHSLWDAYISGKEQMHFLERDDGTLYEESSDEYFTTSKKWPKRIHQALSVTRGRVLDIGCGVGRHALYLQKHGIDVTGIDTSSLLIKASRKRGLRKAKVMSLHKLKFRPKSFDTVIMLWNNFGLFGSRQLLKSDLKKLTAITTPVAKIVAEFNDPYQTSNPIHLAYHKWNRKRGRMSGQVRLRVRYKTFIDQWFDYLFVSKSEMGKLLKNTDWRVEKFIGQGPSYIAILSKRQ